MFDAGAIMAHLDIETGQFDRKLTAAESRIHRLEHEPHQIRLDAVFNNASLGRARQIFTQLDQQLSREAMMRLRSSPQGSVLGALNALFSPHPVTGGPSPQQSATQGLLGRMVGAQGGGMPGRAAPGMSSVLLGQAAGTGPAGTARVKIDNIGDLADAISNGPGQAPSGPDPGTARAADNTRRAAEASERSAASSADAARSAASAAQDSSSATHSFLRGFLGVGGGGGGGGGRLLGSFLGSRSGSESGTRATLTATGFAGQLAGGIGPNILGANFLTKRAALFGGLGAIGGATLPALAGVAGTLGVAGLGVGALGGLFHGATSQVGPLLQAQQKAQQALSAAQTPAQVKTAQQNLAGVNAQVRQLSPALQSIFRSEQQIQDWWQKFTQSFAPMFAGPLHQVASLLGGLTPVLHGFFAGAGTLIQPLIGGLGDLARQVLPLLASSFRAVAPLLRPLLDGIAGLVSGILPGLNALLRASAPAVSAFAGGLGVLGRGLGEMFSQFAPVVRASSTILSALLDVLSGLFPIIGTLAQVFARTLAPIFVQFAGIIRSLMPFLVTVGKLFASLASAVLGDLVSAFGALAQLLSAISPALNAFATAFSAVFTVLENSGVFAVIGDALEALVKPLGTMISQLLNGLTPLLPPIIAFLGQMSSILVQGLAAAVVALLPPLTRLALVVLQALAQTLPILLPLFISLTGILTAAFVRVVSDLATALDFVVRSIPPRALRDIALGFTAIWLAVKAGGIISAVSNPVGLITIAVAALVVGIVELVTHWHRIWTDIKNWANDAWRFLNGLFRNRLVQDILAVWTLGLLPLAEHWSTVWRNIRNWANDARGFLSRLFRSGIVQDLLAIWSLGLVPLFTHWSSVFGGFKRVASDFWGWLSRVFGSDVAGFFTRTLPGWFDTAVANIGRMWNKVKGVITWPVKFVIDNVLDGLISVFDTITHAVGIPVSIKPVHPFGLAGGGKITRGTTDTADDVHIRVSKNETVLSAFHSRMLEPLLAAIGVPGYARGGKVGQHPPVSPITARTGPGANIGGPAAGPLGGILHKIADIGKITAAVFSGNSAALTNAFSDLIGLHSGAAGLLGTILTKIPQVLVKDIVNFVMGQAGMGADGNAIVKYAMQWIGKIPYVWGGVAVPGGADCSGFTQAIYRHFGIIAPRTSEGQGAWVRRGPPVPGSLAFYHSPPGGPDPGHVAIVRNINQVISQGGGMGPQLIGINALPLLWTGSPPGGIGHITGLPGVAATGPLQSYARKLVDATWGDNFWPAFADIVRRESNWDVTATNPNGGAYGIPQALPAGKMASAGPDWRTNGYTQLRWMVDYIKTAWGNPFAADMNEVEHHWYRNGGAIREPVIGYGTQSGDRYHIAENGTEWVSRTPPGSQVAGAGAMIGTVYIQLPEGQTVGRALSEMNFWLSVAAQQGYAGVLPGG